MKSVSQTAPTVDLDSDDVAAWAAHPFETLFTLSRAETERPQLEALVRRFEQLRPRVAALNALATRQRVDRIEKLEDAAPAFFDHRVYKSYPISLIERRQFNRMTEWLQRLTTHDLSAIPMDDVTSVDSWLERLDAHGMIMLHSTGTTGKLSFVPRSQAEWPAWKWAFPESQRAATGGFDRLKEAVPTFWPGYRTGHNSSVKMQRIFQEISAGGEANRHCLYDYAISSDLLSLAARLQTADERGELDALEIDPRVLREQAKLIEAGRHREEDLEKWLTKLAQEYRGRRVKIHGLSADLVRLALKGRERGIKFDFTPDSVLFIGGGMKGWGNAPEDWPELLRHFFGIERLSSLYGMTECMGTAPICDAGYYHFFPYTIPLLLDPDGQVLPREGMQTGRCALFDLLAESYWGGFVSGDRITIYWDDDCECGWRGPRLDGNIVRFSELEGGDDKISCAGTEQAYSEFMEYVSNI